MIETRSSFIYGFLVDENSNTFVIDEGSGNVDCVIRQDTYSFTEYAAAVKIAINNFGTQVYTVTANRDRTLTIAATNNFELKPSAVGVGLSAFEMMGFTTDTTGANTYTSDTKSGKEYLPQYYLQDYESLDSNAEYKNVHKNETMSGHIETITHNKVRFLVCVIKFITNLDMRDSSITNDQAGYDKAVDFLNYLITGGKIEFIEDITDYNTYNTLILEGSKNSFKLKEETDFRHIYKTSTLKFREVN
jgi:hypothetical protein